MEFVEAKKKAHQSKKTFCKFNLNFSKKLKKVHVFPLKRILLLLCPVNPIILFIK